jgi:hypothetical protein
MHDSEIFAALEKVRTSAGALTRAARRLLPQLEGDLQRLGAVCAGDGPGLAFARAFVEELVRPVREVTPALREYMTPLEDSSMDDPDEPPSSGLGAERPCAGINFGRFTKLEEFGVAERVIEVMAPLRDKRVAGLLRLEALRAPDEPGYLVAVYRQAEAPVTPRDGDGTVLHDRSGSAHVWAQYDLIHSDRPTAEKALEQALLFLEMRCD